MTPQALAILAGVDVTRVRSVERLDTGVVPACILRVIADLDGRDTAEGVREAYKADREARRVAVLAEMRA